MREYEDEQIPQEFMDMLDEADRSGLSVRQKAADEEYKDVLLAGSVNTNEANVDLLVNEGTNDEGHGTDHPEERKPSSSPATERREDQKNEGDDKPLVESARVQNVPEQTAKVEYSEDKSGQKRAETSISVDGGISKPVGGGHSSEKPLSSVSNIGTQKPAPATRESVEDRLKKEWERKKNTEVRRPASHVSQDQPCSPQPAEGTTATEENFFNGRSSDSSYTPSMGASSRTNQSINRSCTDAQRIAEEAQDKVDINNMFGRETSENKYSFRWFKLLLELMYSDRRKESHVEIQLDFSEYKVVGKMLVLTLPSKTLPKWLAHAEHLSVSLLKNRKKAATVNGGISSMTEDAVWVSVGPYDNLNAFEDETGRVRLNADGTTFTFIESFMTRFLQLGFDDSFNLRDNIPECIEYIYGPPGTGKTFEVVKRLSSIVADESLGSDTIVMAPTNRAADEIVERLLDTEEGRRHCFRFGDTQSPKILMSGNLISRDSSFTSFDKPRVIVTTAARFAYDFLDSSNALCEWPWDHVFIDEASMIDVATISYILHKAQLNNKDTQFVIAGDPHQLQPVESNDVQPENIYNMVGLDSFKRAMERPDVMGLTLQHRSVSPIGELVSRFAYDGLLKHERGSNVDKPLILTGYENLKNINFIGFRTELLDPIYGPDAIGGSSFQIYSVILAYNFAEYIVSEVSKLGYDDYSVGIVCPFKAQADAILGMLENRPIDNAHCKVKCGTVHKFQGSECDTVIVVMNTPAEVTSGSHVNNRNLVNVAISRAKDYLFLMTPDHSIERFWTRERLGELAEEHSIKFGKDIEKMVFGREGFIEANVKVSVHMPVNIYYEPSKLYEVKIDDTAADIQINDWLRTENED